MRIRIWIRIQRFWSMRIRIRIRIQVQGFDEQKLNITAGKKYIFFYQKLQFTYPEASIKEV
jgi:hypothetical protein